MALPQKLDAWLIRKTAACFHPHRNSDSGWSKASLPKKIELAPAKKQRACSSQDRPSLPAERRIIALGMAILAVAIIRTISQIGSGLCSCKGVPFIGTKRLIGTDAGCGCLLARTWTRLIRSSTLSPIPIIPPQQTLKPAFSTASSVSSRS